MFVSRRLSVWDSACRGSATPLCASWTGDKSASQSEGHQQQSSCPYHAHAVHRHYRPVVPHRAGLTMVPNVSWHRAPRRKGPPAPRKKFFLGYLIVIYIGNQITDIYAIRYHTSTVHGWKIIKIVATRAALFGSNMHQIVCRLGLRPRPHWGSLQRSPRPPSWI